MTDWTDERHTEAREWCKGGGSKSRDFAAALDEIERLQVREKDECNQRWIAQIQVNRLKTECDTLREVGQSLVDAYISRRVSFIENALRTMRDVLKQTDANLHRD